MVVIFLPSAADIGVLQERIGLPSSSTVQAPHSAAPQPNFVPVMPRVSRSTQRSGVLGSALTSRALPLMVRLAICASLTDRWVLLLLIHCAPANLAAPLQLETTRAARIGGLEPVVDIEHALDPRGDLGAGDALLGRLDAALERHAPVQRARLDPAVRGRGMGAQRRAHVMGDGD